MRKPCSLECETVEVTGKSLRMFPIGKQEGWLIGMVTGKLGNKRALKRCGIFISLKDRLQSSVDGASAQQPAIDNKMATMRFDDEEEVSPVKKNSKRSRELDEEDSPDGRRARYFVSTPHMQVKVPEEASSKEERDVWLMSRKGRLWIDEDNLAWIVSWVKADLECGGVDPVEHDVKTDSGIWWNFQEDCWVAQRTRDGGVDGQPIQRRGHVERRSKTRGDCCFGLSKEAAKKVVFDELSGWLQKPE